MKRFVELVFGEGGSIFVPGVDDGIWIVTRGVIALIVVDFGSGCL